MADDHEHTFESTDAGASKCIPQQCSALRKGGFVLIKEKPCKIVEMSTSKTGKHGHAKVHLVGIDIFTAKKYEDICPSTHNMNVPKVSRTEWQVVDIDDSDNSVQLMDDAGNLKEDLFVPAGEIGDKLRGFFEKASEGSEEMVMATVLQAMDSETIIDCKIAK